MDRENVAEDLRQMIARGVYIDPLLAYTYFRNSTDAVYLAACETADRMYERYVRVDEFGARLGDLPFSTTFMRSCIVNTLLSTAIVRVYESTGSVSPNREHLVEAAMALNEFATVRGIDRLYMLYILIAGHDVLQPLYYYSGVAEIDFLNGTKHHPLPPEVMDVALLLGMARRFLRIKRAGKLRTVHLTRAGVDRLRYGEWVMAKSGYREKRMWLSYVYQFDVVEDWDAMCGVVWPLQCELKKAFTEWLDIGIGARVMEAACGTGTLTFEGNLYESVGSTGQLIAVDVSTGMLQEAKRKHAIYGFPEQVSFGQSSMKQLPFEDGSFDAAVGCGFLHFTYGPRALEEMRRVVAVGGSVAALQALHFDLDRPFFRDWFEPVFDLAKRRNSEPPKNYLPHAEQLMGWFEQVGITSTESREVDMPWVFDNPDVVVQHLLRGVKFFQNELMALPWDYRRSIVTELVDRGRDVCRKYPLKERTIEMPCIMVKGVVPERRRTVV